jgi:hypothetical protein
LTTRAAILALALPLLAPGPASAVDLGRVEELSRTLADSFGGAAAASDRCGATYRAGLRRQLDAFLARYVDADAAARAGSRFERAAASGKGDACDRAALRERLAYAQDTYTRVAGKLAEMYGR